MKVRPLHDKILVRIPSKKEETMKSGLIIPSSVTSLNENAFVGQVISVGKGRLKSDTTRSPAPTVEPGDKVYLGRYAGTRLYIDGVLCMIVHPKEILGVLDDEEVTNFDSA